MSAEQIGYGLIALVVVALVVLYIEWRSRHNSNRAVAASTLSPHAVAPVPATSAHLQVTVGALTKVVQDECGKLKDHVTNTCQGVKDHVSGEVGKLKPKPEAPKAAP